MNIVQLYTQEDQKGGQKIFLTKEAEKIAKELQKGYMKLLSEFRV